MTDRELMQEVLEALQAVKSTPASKDDIQRAWIVADLLKRRLAQPEQKQRQWQGLARLELQKAVEGLEDLEDCWIAIESALREKNT
jgi:argininosuccinate lyase